MRVLIAPDKFKGTLTASQAARAIAAGWKKARPNDHLFLLPITDGGDGFGRVLSQLWHVQRKIIHTIDAAHRPIRVQWCWDPSRKSAIIESAAVIGLAQLPHKRFHPFELDTRGLAKVISAAADLRARRCIIGIGGSATNDAGFGLALALGWQFLDLSGKPICRWIDLHSLAHIKPPPRTSFFHQLIVAVDVRNPLLGKHGATRIYGPQKGLTPRDFPLAEKSLRRLARIVRKDLHLDLATLPGAGAAGGLGFGLAAFLKAPLVPGFDLFAHEAGLPLKVRHADLVITAEGRLDASSFMGKSVGEIAKLCRHANIPCIALAGNISPSLKSLSSFKSFSLTSVTTIRAAKTNPAFWLKRLSEKAARNCTACPISPET